MNIVHSIILGIVEGFTEFLPISSTGHLIIASKILGITDSNFLSSFEIIIQLGAILAVITLFFKELWGKWDIIKKVSIAFIPTIVIGLTAYSVVKKYLIGNITLVLWSLLIGGIIIVLFEKYFKSDDNTKNINFKNAFWLGVFQTLAFIPGVSRSGATIIGGIALGLEKKAVVLFSFFLAIPTMFAASALDIYKSNFSFTSKEVLLISIGFITAYITAIIAMKSFLKFIQNNSFTSFGIYRIIIGIIGLMILYF